MNNQKLISMRIDKCVLWQVDQEATVNTLTRNGILNKGGSLYCNLQDSRRNYKIFRKDTETAKKIVIGFLMLYWPEVVTDGIVIKPSMT